MVGRLQEFANKSCNHEQLSWHYCRLTAISKMANQKHTTFLPSVATGKRWADRRRRVSLLLATRRIVIINVWAEAGGRSEPLRSKWTFCNVAQYPIDGHWVKQRQPHSVRMKVFSSTGILWNMLRPPVTGNLTSSVFKFVKRQVNIVIP